MEVDVEAIVKEASAQIASLSSRNLILAGQLSAALKRLAVLEQKNAKKTQVGK